MNSSNEKELTEAEIIERIILCKNGEIKKIEKKQESEQNILLRRLKQGVNQIRLKLACLYWGNYRINTRNTIEGS